MFKNMVIYLKEKVIPLIVLLLIVWTIWTNYQFTKIYIDRLVVTQAQQLIQQAQQQQNQNRGQGPVRQPIAPQNVPQQGTPPTPQPDKGVNK
jgi:hypothetical protein